MFKKCQKICKKIYEKNMKKFKEGKKKNIKFLLNNSNL